VTERLPVMVTFTWLVAAVTAPDQPPKNQPVLGVAVNATVTPDG